MISADGMRGRNIGISLRDVLTLSDIDRKVYASITGDQMAITNIHIKMP
jgi:hypothetical protein